MDSEDEMSKSSTKLSMNLHLLHFPGYSFSTYSNDGLQFWGPMERRKKRHVSATKWEVFIGVKKDSIDILGH